MSSFVRSDFQQTSMSKDNLPKFLSKKKKKKKKSVMSLTDVTRLILIGWAM